MQCKSQLGDVFFVSGEDTLSFRAPREILVARELPDVIPCLARAEAAARDGGYAAGFIAYEAAPAFDSALHAHSSSLLPLAWFALYDAYCSEAPPQSAATPLCLDSWQAGMSENAYWRSVEVIRERIAAGDTYQVNCTFPMRATFTGDVYTWFQQLHGAQATDYAAFLDLGDFGIASMSPELFFRLDGNRLVTKPMKGTRRRSCCGEEDQRLRTELAASAKDQAENVMIVDLLRNDMGQISRTGSVCVEKLFEIEQYETVWQMTSTVASQTDASIVEIFSALFPCGSVTGAPKVKTTEIIKELESFPRGVYCGAIGWIGPGRQAQFSVAIRTATVDRQRQTAVYNVGAGITYDSVPQDEYDECMAKAAVLRRSCPAFELLESIRHDETGYYLLDGHLTRLSRSAAHFGRKICVAEVAESLRAYAAELGSGPEKVRLLLAHDGTYRIESSPLSTPDRFRLGFAATPTCTDSPFISHKTTRREHYDQARATRPDCDDVLLWNEHGEITESTIANVALKIDGEWLTPSGSSGLLEGVFRASLLAAGVIREAVLHKTDVEQAEEIALINSVRKWMDVEWIPFTDSAPRPTATASEGASAP